MLFRNTKLKIAILIVLLGLTIAALLLNHKAAAPALPPYAQSDHALVTLKGKAFFGLVANNPQTREKGLSGTEPLAPAQSMLFVFEPGQPTCFWMKDMNYNIDILWFDATSKLIYQERDLAPATYPTSYCPPSSATYVLEVKAGTAEQLQLQLGDQAKILGKPQAF